MGKDISFGLMVLLTEIEQSEYLLNFYLHKDRYEKFLHWFATECKKNNKNIAKAKMEFLTLKNRIDHKLSRYEKAQRYIINHESDFDLLTKKEDGLYVISPDILTTCDFTKEVLEYKLKEMPGIFLNPVILEPEKKEIINNYYLDEEKDEIELKIRILNLIKEEEKDYEIQTTRK